MTRTPKTPRQRAEEQLAAANRAVARLATKKSALTTELADVSREHDAAVVRRDYLAANPDLQHNPTTSTGATA
jgi:hypothetical protein